MSSSSFDYDYVVLGGGSGGIASAKRTATLYPDKKVAVIERARWGGTCVNVGCVPKKVMYMAASIATTLNQEAIQYGFVDVAEQSNKKQQQPSAKVNWGLLKEKRDAYVKRLNGIYENGLKKLDNLDIYIGDATFVDDHTISIVVVVDENDGSNTTTKTITTSKTCIAVGGRPAEASSNDDDGIMKHSINSDGFFALEEQPNVVVVVGAGYIAVELAGVLRSLGSEVHLVTRHGRALRKGFDPDLCEALHEAMVHHEGIVVHNDTMGVDKITLQDNADAAKKKKVVHLKNGDVIYGVDTVLMAIGRVPNTESLNLDKVGVTTDPRGYITVDDYQNTSNPNIYALGDVCGKVELTPMAIAAGRRLADRLFSSSSGPLPKVSYQQVPTVVFSHPPIGTLGLTEPQAIEKYGPDNIKIYKSKFANLMYGIYTVDSPDDKPKTLMKVITAGITELVVGIHILGMGADEMLQGFGVAMKMGCTKADLDSCVAIHPTASEELVTMGTWGTSPAVSGAQHSPLHGAPPAEPVLLSSTSSSDDTNE